MKLRNRKTGEIVELKLIQVNDKYLEDHEINLLNGKKLTLESPVNSFSDVKEPLIKDKKIRKAVRAWADANNINSRHYHENDVKFDSLEHEFTWIDTSIQFNEFGALEGLEDGKRYTIAELCGEVEE